MSEIQILDPYSRPLPPTEQRASYANPEEWMWEAFGGSRSTAGERVNAKKAMQVMVFFACVRNISEDIAKLPKKIRRELERGSENLPDHPVQLLLDEPNEETNCHVFWQTLVAHACVHHGGFAEIVRNGAGEPAELYILDPTSVTVMRSNTGKIVYRINGQGGYVYLAQKDVIHLHGLGHDGVSGYDIPSIANQLLGAAIALQKYRGSFFGNGATPTGTLEIPIALSKEAQTRLRDQFTERYMGSENAHKPLVLEEGLKWTQVSIDPERAQMDATTNITTADICRIFRMPPHKVQDLLRSTFSNIEHQGIEYVTDALDPWCDKLKHELQRKLLSKIERRSGVKVFINLKGIMRGDMAARAAFYQQLFNMGALTPNQICEYEDMNGYEGGDRYYVQLNLAPVDRLDEILDKQTAKPEPKPTQLPAPSPDPASAAYKAAVDARWREYTNDLEAAVLGVTSAARDGFTMLLANRIEDILRIEADKAQRAKDTPEFWEKHLLHIAQRMRDQIAAVAHGLGSQVDADALANEYAAAHIKASQEDIQGRDLTHWHSGERAKVAAKALLHRIEAAPKEEPCKNIAA